MTKELLKSRNLITDSLLFLFINNLFTFPLNERHLYVLMGVLTSLLSCLTPKKMGLNIIEGM